MCGNVDLKKIFRSHWFFQALKRCLSLLYTAALAAAASLPVHVQHIQRGNVDLKKTIQLNRSSRYYLLVLMVTLSLLLLFFDWFNS
jgi:flagellar biosynthesis protein FlhB